MPYDLRRMLTLMQACTGHACSTSSVSAQNRHVACTACQPAQALLAAPHHYVQKSYGMHRLLQVMYGTESGAYTWEASGKASAYEQIYPGASYISGTFHHVKLPDLLPSTTYYFM
jgi:hypothetical protein